jgi:hypothetical protein
VINSIRIGIRALDSTFEQHEPAVNALELLVSGLASVYNFVPG